MRKLVQDTLRYVGLNYLSLFLTTLRGVLLINILNPVSLGVYKLLFTYTSYFRYYNLGLNALAFYRAPVKGMEETYSYLLKKINTLLAVVFGTFFTIGFSFFWWNSLSVEGNLDFILWLFIILFTTQLAETLITIAKVKKKFNTISFYNLLLAMSSLILMVVLGYWFDLRGVLFGLAVASLISYLYVLWDITVEKKINISFTRRKVVTIFKHSIITIIPGMLIVLFSTMEVWIIALRFGAAETGFYAVVTTFVNLILLLNTDSIVFLYSRRSSKFQKDQRFVMKITAFSFFVIAVVCFIGIFIVDWGIEMFFPAYLPAAAIYKLCFWGIPFLVARNIAVYYITNKKSVLVSWVLLALLIMKIVILLLPDSKELFYNCLAVSNLLFGVILILLFGYHWSLNENKT